MAVALFMGGGGSVGGGVSLGVDFGPYTLGSWLVGECHLWGRDKANVLWSLNHLFQRHRSNKHEPETPEVLSPGYTGKYPWRRNWENVLWTSRCIYHLLWFERKEQQIIILKKQKPEDKKPAVPGHRKIPINITGEWSLFFQSLCHET